MDNELLSVTLLSITTIAFGLLIFLLGRVITCWYFKINDTLKSFETMNKYLKQIADSLNRNKHR